MTNTEFVYKNYTKKIVEFDSEFDERSVKLMLEYFMEDDECKHLLGDISGLSPASFELIRYFLVDNEYH